MEPVFTFRAQPALDVRKRELDARRRELATAEWELRAARQLFTEAEQTLRDAVQSLPPRCRELIAMLFFETPARPYQEIASQLGLAAGSIGFIRGRCLTRLRRELEKKGFR